MGLKFPLESPFPAKKGIEILVQTRNTSEIPYRTFIFYETGVGGTGRPCQKKDSKKRGGGGGRGVGVTPEPPTLICT